MGIEKHGDMQEIKVTTEWLTNTLTKYLEDASAWRSKAHVLELEVKELRQMRERIIRAIDAVYEESRQGNGRGYKYDALIYEVKEAVFPTTTDSGWTYRFSFDREIKRDLDNLRIVK